MYLVGKIYELKTYREKETKVTIHSIEATVKNLTKTFIPQASGFIRRNMRFESKDVSKSPQNNFSLLVFFNYKNKV